MAGHMLPPSDGTVAIPEQRDPERLICDRCGVIVVHTDKHATYHAWLDSHTHDDPGATGAPVPQVAQ